MVNLLEKTTIEADLKQIRVPSHSSYEGIHTDNNLYSCDCDTFGGGEPPCDCNR
jgi:hypothetical protein